MEHARSAPAFLLFSGNRLRSKMDTDLVRDVQGKGSCGNNGEDCYLLGELDPVEKQFELQASSLGVV